MAEDEPAPAAEPWAAGGAADRPPAPIARSRSGSRRSARRRRRGGSGRRRNGCAAGCAAAGGGGAPRPPRPPPIPRRVELNFGDRHRRRQFELEPHAGLLRRAGRPRAPASAAGAICGLWLAVAVHVGCAATGVAAWLRFLQRSTAPCGSPPRPGPARHRRRDDRFRCCRSRCGRTRRWPRSSHRRSMPIGTMTSVYVLPSIGPGQPVHHRFDT